MPSTIVSFHSICEVCSLGHAQADTLELTHHCQSARTTHARDPRRRSISLPRWRSRSARDPLFSSQRARPRTWGNPFGRGLSPCRRNTSCSTCLSFLRLVLAFLFAFLFALAFASVFAFAFHEHVNFHWCGVVPVRYAPLSVRLMHRFPLTSERIVPLQPRRVQSNMSLPFWILWVVCHSCCFDRV